MKKTAHPHRLVAALLTLSALASVHAQELPPSRHSGETEYVTGGVGGDESAAFKRQAAQWPLVLEFAVQERPRPAYASDVQVDVLNAKGETVLQADGAGPFLLARLPAGSYTVKATRGGKRVEKKVTVKASGSSRAMFVWPGDGAAGSAASAP